MLHQKGLQWGDETFGLLVSTYWASEKCNFESTETQLVVIANLLLRGVCGSFRENYKKSRQITL